MRRRYYLAFAVCYLALYVVLNWYVLHAGDEQLRGSWILVPLALLQTPGVLLWVIFRWDIDFARDAVAQAPVHLAYYLLLVFSADLLVRKARALPGWWKLLPVFGIITEAAVHTFLALGFLVAVAYGPN